MEKAGAEVIQCQSNAKASDVHQRLFCFLTIEKNRFREFQLKTRWGKTGGGKGLLDGCAQISAMQLDRRDIDRDLVVITPTAGVPAGLLQNPLTNFNDHAGLFGSWNEDIRRNKAPVGMTPAQQSFVTQH